MKLITKFASLIIASSLSVGIIGCEATPQPIPSTAKMVGEGTGQVAYRTPAAGQIYVFDQTWNQMVYSGQVDGNRLVQVDPATGRTTIDGQLVVEKPLGGGDQFKIYFEPANHITQTTTVERQTVTEERHASD